RRDHVDAAVLALAARSRLDPRLAARSGRCLSWVTPGADRGVRLARVRTVPAQRTGRRARAVVADRARAVRRPHRRDEPLPRHRGALPALWPAPRARLV